MSRIGKQPIQIPESVTVTIDDDTVTVKGPKGELSQDIHREVTVTIEEKNIIVSRKNEKGSAALWGLMRALIANMVRGVTEGYQKDLEIEGVGYRATLEGDTLVLNLGFSHPINFSVPKDVTVSVEGNAIKVSGIKKQEVGQVAANIRSFRKPEPYKGKGIHYLGEHIRRKAGKKAATTA